MKAKILLATPSYDRWVLNSQKLTLDRAGMEFAIVAMENSLLAHGFNVCLVTALNARESGCTHFAMIHSDVEPIEKDWLAILYQEMQEQNATMMSAIIAIKDKRHLTSTAYYPKSLEGKPFNRANASHIPIQDVEHLPRTFDAERMGRHNDYLLVNTGLFILDLTQPWWDLEPYPHFAIESWLEKDSSGKFRAHVLSEDWNISLQLQRKGAKVCATKAVTCMHYGLAAFRTE